MLNHRVAFATLAALLAACGTEDERIPLPTEKLENPVAYFGIEPCTCYEFEPEAGGSSAKLGIAVEAVSANLPGGDGVTQEYVMRYRLGGAEQRLYTFRPTDPDLLLRQIRLGGAIGTTWVSDPALPWLRFPVEPRPALETTVHMREVTQTELQDFNFRADYVAETVEASLDGGATTESFDAVRISYQGLPFEEQFRWFVPETGLVRVELETTQGRTKYVLNRKRQLGGNCPMADLVTSPTDVCGVANTN